MANENIPSFVSGRGGSQTSFTGSGASMPLTNRNPMSGLASSLETQSKAKSYLAGKAEKDETKHNSLMALRYQAEKKGFENNLAAEIAQDPSKANPEYIAQKRQEFKDSAKIRPENDEQTGLFERVDLSMDPVFDGKAQGTLIQFQTEQNVSEYDNNMSVTLTDMTMAIREDPSVAVGQVLTAIENSELWLDRLFDENNPMVKEQADLMRDQFISVALSQDGISDKDQETLIKMASSEEAGNQLRKDYKRPEQFSVKRKEQRKAWASFISGKLSAVEVGQIQEDLLNGDLQIPESKKTEFMHYADPTNFNELLKGETTAKAFIQSGNFSSATLGTRLSDARGRLTKQILEDGTELELSLQDLGEVNELTRWKARYDEKATRFHAVMDVNTPLRDANNAYIALRKHNPNSEDLLLMRNIIYQKYFNFQVGYGEQDLEVLPPEEMQVLKDAEKDAFSFSLDDDGEVVFEDAQRAALGTLMSMLTQATPQMSHALKQQIKDDPDISLDHGVLEIITDTWADGSSDLTEEIYRDFLLQRSNKEFSTKDLEFEKELATAMSQDEELGAYSMDSVYNKNDVGVLRAWASFQGGSLSKELKKYGATSFSSLEEEDKQNILRTMTFKVKDALKKTFVFGHDGVRNRAVPKYNQSVFVGEDGKVRLSEIDNRNLTQAKLNRVLAKQRSIASLIAGDQSQGGLFPSINDIRRGSYNYNSEKDTIFIPQEWVDQIGVGELANEESYNRLKDGFVKFITSNDDVDTNVIFGHMGTDFTGDGVFEPLRFISKSRPLTGEDDEVSVGPFKLRINSEGQITSNYNDMDAAPVPKTARDISATGPAPAFSGGRLLEQPPDRLQSLEKELKEAEAQPDKAVGFWFWKRTTGDIKQDMSEQFKEQAKKAFFEKDIAERFPK